MKYILLWLFLIVQILPQGYGSYGRNKNIPKFYYTYTPETDTAINVTPYSATLIGNDNRVKSNRADTLATNKTPYRYMVIVGVDSLSGKRVNFTGLDSDTEYSYYYSMIIKANDGDLDYYKGETKAFTTATMFAGTYMTTSEGKYWTNSDGKFITIGD